MGSNPTSGILKGFLIIMEKDILLEKVVTELCGRERQIVDDFCKAFLAQKILEGFDPKFLFDKFVLNVKHDWEKGSQYWFSWKDDSKNQM